MSTLSREEILEAYYDEEEAANDEYEVNCRPAQDVYDRRIERAIQRRDEALRALKVQGEDRNNIKEGW